MEVHMLAVCGRSKRKTDGLRGDVENAEWRGTPRGVHLRMCCTGFLLVGGVWKTNQVVATRCRLFVGELHQPQNRRHLSCDSVQHRALDETAWLSPQDRS